MNSTYRYFDYNATTPVAADVLAEMYPFFNEHFANPSSVHQLSRIPSKALRKARREVAALLGVLDENEIIFTSGGTESNNTAIRAALAITGKKEIVTSAVEHSSVLKLCRQLENEGYQVHTIPVNGSGVLDLEKLKNCLSDRTAVVSIMHANNETGVIFTIEEIARLVKERVILFHVDAVQTVGKLSLHLEKSGIDFLSLSAHKFYGPKGAGALYAKKSAGYQPMVFGGSQERGRRSGTENVPGIVGLGSAAHLVGSDLASEGSRIKALRDDFEWQVCREIQGTEINGGSVSRISNTSNISFEGISGESLLMALDQKNICVSTGSACMSGASEPSHVLKAMGLSDEKAKSAIRFSFGRLTKKEDVRDLIQALKESINQILAAKPEVKSQRECLVKG